jgi:hypothetical protein
MNAHQVREVGPRRLPVHGRAEGAFATRWSVPERSYAQPDLIGSCPMSRSRMRCETSSPFS